MGFAATADRVPKQCDPIRIPIFRLPLAIFVEVERLFLHFTAPKRLEQVGQLILQFDVSPKP